MAAMLVDRHIADFNVRRPIGPFADMENSDNIITSQQCHLVTARPNQPHLIFAMNCDILLITSGLDVHRIPFVRLIHCFLDRCEISGTVQRDDDGPGCNRPWSVSPCKTGRKKDRETGVRFRQPTHGLCSYIQDQREVNSARSGCSARGFFQQAQVCSAAMILVGLTGGLATGKTTAANMFKDCGAVRIDADQLAREVVEPDRPAWREIVKTFGSVILHRDRTLNRSALASVVFRHQRKRRTLERIIHPRVARRQATLTRVAARKNPRAVIIYEVPLLFEAGVDKRVDSIVVVTANRETQIARLKRRNGFTRAEALRRIQSQLPLAAKKARADFILNGTIPRAALRAEVRRLYRVFQRLA